ncbi:MAG: ribulokinase [Bacteroidales bacterium]|nr:ribulokinase [Bacteroidales bacterium]
MKDYVIGIDFGTDSARAILVDAADGTVLSGRTSMYPRWAKGLYCDARTQQFRQHPLDYIECLETVLKGVVAECPDPSAIRAIAVDTTASTPCFCDAQARPLALLEGFEENPNAMFVLWKDHSGTEEAKVITRTATSCETNYTCLCGNDYSPECFWSKVWHLINVDEAVYKAGVSVIELCDFIPALLTGVQDWHDIKPGRCVAGAKHLWSERWGGFPPDSFFDSLDPRLAPIKDRLVAVNATSDHVAGKLCSEWAAKLGLSTDVKVGYGMIDAHSGGVGAGIRTGRYVINMGTSGCLMFVMPKEVIGDRIVDGVFGQADDSIIPGCVGFEAGLSAMGDAYAWFRKLISWPLQQMAAQHPELAAVIEEAQDGMIARLTEAAEALPLDVDAPFANDNFNGRRSPNPTADITATIAGLKLTTQAPEIFRAIAESTVFGFKAITDYLEKCGIEAESFVGVGGISRKSPYIMQMFADAFGRDLAISDCKDSCAMGVAMFAAVIAGIYPDIEAAQDAMCPAASVVYHPDKSKAEYYAARYEKYLAAVRFSEQE